MHFVCEWWSKTASLSLSIVSIITGFIGFVSPFVPENISRSIRKWGRQMKPLYKWILRILSIVLIIGALVWTAINIFNEQQNKIVSLNNEITNLMHPKPSLQTGMYYAIEDLESNTVIIRGKIAFINNGNGAAYQVQVRGCYATSEDVSHLTDFSYELYRTSIPAGGNYTVPFLETFPPSVIGNATTSAISTTPWLYIYCALRCSDAQNGGNWSEWCPQWLGFSQGLMTFTPLKESLQTDAFASAVKLYYGN